MKQMIPFNNILLTFQLSKVKSSFWLLHFDNLNIIYLCDFRYFVDDVNQITETLINRIFCWHHYLVFKLKIPEFKWNNVVKILSLNINADQDFTFLKQKVKDFINSTIVYLNLINSLNCIFNPSNCCIWIVVSRKQSIWDNEITYFCHVMTYTLNIIIFLILKLTHFFVQIDIMTSNFFILLIQCFFF